MSIAFALGVYPWQTLIGLTFRAASRLTTKAEDRYAVPGAAEVEPSLELAKQGTFTHISRKMSGIAAASSRHIAQAIGPVPSERELQLTKIGSGVLNKGRYQGSVSLAKNMSSFGARENAEQLRRGSKQYDQTVRHISSGGRNSGSLGDVPKVTGV